MSRELERVPARQRRQLALLLAPVGAVLLVAGVLLAWRAASLPVHLLGAVVTILALLGLGVAHGLYYSARGADAERQLDEAILAGSGGGCGAGCGSCGDQSCALGAGGRSASPAGAG